MEEGSDILQITGNSTDVLLVQVKDSNSYKVYKDNIADVGERVSLDAGRYNDLRKLYRFCPVTVVLLKRDI